MYHTGADHYDSPPPTSYFRTHRPWSPDPADALPSVQHDQRRREGSESSVDALDLADYARRIQPEYPPSPPPARPFSVASRTTPSLVSSPDTLSSQSHSGAPRYNSRAQRHFSLPPPMNSYNSFSTPRTPHDDAGWSPYIRNSLDSVQEYPDPSYARIPRDGDSELDVAQFPAWSRHWYAKERAQSNRSTIPAGERPAFFDPTYNPSTDFSPLSHQSHSSRDVLPWGPDGPNYGAPIDEDTKEERVRMLEREFGKEAMPGPDAPEARVIGSVDDKGRLITQGPRKRMAARVLEILLALAIAVSSIYAAVEIKPTKTPPPAGKPSTYVLYILSVVTFLAALFMFALRPCCCGRRKASTSAGLTGGGLGGLTVLPVGGAPGKKGKKGKKGQQEGVQVNLIVDPSAFMPGGFGREEEGWGDDDGNTDLTSASRGRKNGAGPRRRTVFEGLALERNWMAARKELKWTSVSDGAGLVLWGIVFVWTLLSGACPPGGFDGYCNAWNVAEAGSCLIALAFGFSLYFSIVDLHQSRQSPRTRP